MKFDYYLILVCLCIYKSITSTRLNKYRTTFSDLHLSLLKRDIGNLYSLCYLNTMKHHENEDAHLLADKFLYLFHVSSRLHTEVLIRPRTHVIMLLKNPTGFWEEVSAFLHANFSKQDGLTELKDKDEILYQLLEWLMGTSVCRSVVPDTFDAMMERAIRTIMEQFSANKSSIIDSDDSVAKARVKCLVGLCRTESLIRRMLTLNASGEYRERYDISYLGEFDKKLTKGKAAITERSDAFMLRYLMANHHYEPFMPYYLHHA